MFGDYSSVFNPGGRFYDYVHANFLQEDIVKLHKIFEIPSLTRICMFGKSSVVQYF